MDIQLPQSDPLLIRQDTGATAVSGQTSLAGTQNIQMLFPLAAHGTDGAHCHRIQHRRNRAHIILAQQQNKQPLKCLIAPDRFPQHIVKLLQRSEQNFPKLIQNLRAAVILSSIQLLGQLSKPPRKLNILQKTINRPDLIRKTHSRAEFFLQGNQRFDGILSGLFNSCPVTPDTIGPDSAEALRVIGPFLFPAVSVHSPDNRIIFHQITGFRLQRR